MGSGTLSCSKIFPGKVDPTFLKAYQAGEAFGELALLYDAPRAATITASEDCVLWKLDRDTFNHIVKDAAQRRREKYEAFLEQVPIFETMEPYERPSWLTRSPKSASRHVNSSLRRVSQVRTSSCFRRDLRSPLRH